MATNYYGRRYIKVSDFVDYAKYLGLHDPFLSNVLEFAERFGVVTPAARVRFPQAVVRRWFQARYPSMQVMEPIEPDTDVLTAATSLRDAIAMVAMRRTELPKGHPLDTIARKHRPFVTKKFPTAAFRPWSTHSEPLYSNRGNVAQSDEGTISYYHAWQAFQLAAFLRSGYSVLYDVGSEHDVDLLDLPRTDILMTANFDARHELKRLHDNSALFDAVAQFEDRCRRALQVIARGVDRQTGRLSSAASKALRSGERKIARDVVAKAKLTPARLIAFIQLQCGLWAEAADHYPAAVVGAYKDGIWSTIELLQASNPRISIAAIKHRVGTFGGFHRPLLEVIFPDWVSEQRFIVEASIQQWIVPKLAAMPPQFAFSPIDVGAFCDWVEAKGFLQLYWHFRRLTDVGRFDDQVGRSATTVEIVGLAALIEHLANQALADRKPPENLAGTFKPKLIRLFGPSSTLGTELKKGVALSHQARRSALSIT